MALYRFTCECGFDDYIDQPIMAEHEANCETCGKRMQRVWGSPKAILFRGAPAWFDKKKAALNADYARHSHCKIQEEKGVRVNAG